MIDIALNFNFLTFCLQFLLDVKYYCYFDTHFVKFYYDFAEYHPMVNIMIDTNVF
jgi:hypothetical protein